MWAKRVLQYVAINDIILLLVKKYRTVYLISVLPISGRPLQSLIIISYFELLLTIQCPFFIQSPPSSFSLVFSFLFCDHGRAFPLSFHSICSLLISADDPSISISSQQVCWFWDASSFPTLYFSLMFKMSGAYFFQWSIRSLLVSRFKTNELFLASY